MISKKSGNMKWPGGLFRSFRTKLMLALVGAVLLSGILSNFIVYEHSLASQFKFLRGILTVITQTVALSVDPAVLEMIPAEREGIYSPQYKIVEEKLSNIRKIIPAISYIYVLKKTDRPGILKFVIDIRSGGTGQEKRAPASHGDEYDASGFPEMLEGFNAPSADKKITSDEWGASISAYAPIRRPDGTTAAILGLDMSASDLAVIQKEVRKRAAAVLALAVFFAVVLGIPMSARVTGPIKKLAEGTRHVAEGDLYYEVGIKGGDEIAGLAESFNIMSRRLKKYIGELERTTAEKERLLKELEIAKDIQQSFLPLSAPVINGYDIAASTFPARIVGGDFYDFIPVEKEKWGITVADVSGKGMPAALFMALCRTVLRASTIGKLSIADAIVKANQLIVEDSRTNLFVTLFYALLDSKNNRLEYVNAGHNPPLLIREAKNDIVLLKAQGIPLGLFPQTSISTAEIGLESGDVLAIYTDGVVEALNGNNEQFGTERLSRSVTENRSLPPRAIIEKIQDELKSFTGDEPQFDDITLMVLKVI
ncbi:MAG: PP2C family protein-serine/threonine phosphatase [Candidatus Omnitrophota bacterium]